MPKSNHKQTIAALRRRNQRLVEENASIRRERIITVDERELAEKAEMIAILQGISFEEALEKAKKVAEEKKKYLESLREKDEQTK